MNAGTTKYAIRIPDDLMSEIKEAMDASSPNRKEGPWTLSDWVRTAIIEKLAKRERGNKMQATRRTITKKIRLELSAE